MFVALIYLILVLVSVILVFKLIYLILSAAKATFLNEKHFIYFNYLNIIID